MSLTLNLGIIAALLCDTTDAATGRGEPSTQTEAFNVAAVTPELMDAWVLQGPHGCMLRQLATPDSALARISSAIQRIRSDYAKPLRIAALAEEVAMSESAFHRNFKSATALSPLQYQKQLRLLQARQLLTAHGRSVTATALDVGYESPTQFSREYARALGLPPSRDAARIMLSVRGSAHA
ncbi:MAG: AraC family transcriptional regulator [Stenotrophomonas rhizophila]|nr:AraC family transcriptional regulator [Stenotrophomonas rhizophila]